MIKIVSFKICPFVQRVTSLLEAKNIQYEIEFIDLSNKPQWFNDISPNGQVPVLITESGIPLFESDAIVEYLDEVTPLLRQLTPEERAIERAWGYQGTKHYLTQCSAMRSPSLEELEARTKKLTKGFAGIDKKLGDGPFFGGEQIGNVDVAWLPILHRASIVKEHTGVDQLDGFPNLQKWQENLLLSGLPNRSVPSDFEDRFVGFYLSEKTYLGHQRRADLSEISREVAESVAGAKDFGAEATEDMTLDDINRAR